MYFSESALQEEQSVGNLYVTLGGVALNGSSAPQQTPSIEHTLAFILGSTCVLTWKVLYS